MWIFDYLYSAPPAPPPLSVPLKIAQITELVVGLLITEGYAAKRGPIMMSMALHCCSTKEKKKKSEKGSPQQQNRIFCRRSIRMGYAFFAAGREIRRSDGSGWEMKQHDTDVQHRYTERTGIGIGIPTAVEGSGHCKERSLSE